MTHSSRPTLIFNSVISKITPVFSLRHVRREGLSPAKLRKGFFFFRFPHTVNTKNQRTGEWVRKLKWWARIWTERKENTHWMGLRGANANTKQLGPASPDVKSPWPDSLTVTVVAPVAPSHHTLLLLTVLSQGCLGQDKALMGLKWMRDWPQTETEREVSVSLPLVNDSGEIEAETTFCGELCVLNSRLGKK